MARRRAKSRQKRKEKNSFSRVKLKGKQPIEKQKSKKGKKAFVVAKSAKNEAKMSAARHFVKLPRNKNANDGPLLSLRERAEERLKEARFRIINENLYKMTGDEAQDMFKNDPDSFRVYQEGFSNQTKKWPVNPVDIILKKIKNRSPKLIVADFGCGNAILAQNLKNTVHSFDFVASNEHVTVCDISNVPLPDGSVDIAVFCLSLMGTNWPKYLAEANRTLKSGGSLLIADISSRFTNIDRFEVALGKIGFSVTSKDLTHRLFLFFDCKKVSTCDVKKLPDLKLRPCLYKRR